jgi:predicted nucleotidyltransferase
MKRLPIDSEELTRFCERNHVRQLALFGSVLKGTAGPESDIDLLVEFEPSAQLTMLDLAAMEEELSGLLGGRRVDLRTPGELSRYFREQVVREAEVQYFAG